MEKKKDKEDSKYITCHKQVHRQITILQCSVKGVGVCLWSLCMRACVCGCVYAFIHEERKKRFWRERGSWGGLEGGNKLRETLARDRVTCKR